MTVKSTLKKIKNRRGHRNDRYSLKKHEKEKLTDKIIIIIIK